AHAVEVQGAAGNVDDVLEIGDLLLARGGDNVAHAPLLAVERLSGERSGEGEEREGRETDRVHGHRKCYGVPCSRNAGCASPGWVTPGQRLPRPRRGAPGWPPPRAPRFRVSVPPRPRR